MNKSAKVTLRVCKTPVSVITDESAEDQCSHCRALGFHSLAHTETLQEQFHILSYKQVQGEGERQDTTAKLLVGVVYGSYKLHGETLPFYSSRR